MVAYILPLSTSDCYLLYIFFCNYFKNIYIKCIVYINISCIFTKNLKLIIMTKVFLNTGKNLEILSNNGRFRLIAKMKVDYDAVNDIFGARDWIFAVVDTNIKKNVNLQKNGVNVFEKNKYQYKKELLKAIELANCFSIAISEIKNKNGIKA